MRIVCKACSLAWALLFGFAASVYIEPGVNWNYASVLGEPAARIPLKADARRLRDDPRPAATAPATARFLRTDSSRMCFGGRFSGAKWDAGDDRYFLAQILRRHKSALMLEETASGQSVDPEMRAWAGLALELFPKETARFNELLALMDTGAAAMPCRVVGPLLDGQKK